MGHLKKFIAVFTIILVICQSTLGSFFPIWAKTPNLSKKETKIETIIKPGNRQNTTLLSDPIDWVKGYRQKSKHKNILGFISKTKKSDAEYLSYRYGDTWLNLSPTFGDKTKLTYEINELQVKELIKIEAAPTVPLALSSKFIKEQELKIKINGKIWDEKSSVTTDKRIEFIKNNKTLFYWEPVVYWDSAPETESVIGKVQLSRSGKDLRITMLVDEKMV